MKVEKDFILDMCRLAITPEVGRSCEESLVRLQSMVDMTTQLFQLYGLMGEELGDIARDADDLTLAIHDTLGVDLVDSYRHLLRTNKTVLRHLNMYRDALRHTVPGVWSSDVVAAAGGPERVYAGAVPWFVANATNAGFEAELRRLDDVQRRAFAPAAAPAPMTA